jgi:hypothetical protein
VPDPTLFDAHAVATVPAPLGVSAPSSRCGSTRSGRGAGGEVVRVKGLVDTTDLGLVLVQVVGRRREVTPVPEPERGEPTDLVVISLR